MTMQGEPSDLPEDTLATEEPQQAEQEEAPQAPPDPVQERLERLEAHLGQLAGASQAIHDNLGYLGRQLERLERLASQPQTAEIQEQVAVLSDRVEEVLLRSMPEVDQMDYIKKELESARKPKPAAAVAPPPTPIREGPSAAEANKRVLETEYDRVQGELAEYCEDIGYPYPLLVAKLQPLIARDELHRGDGTANDPRGWGPFVRQAKAFAKKEKELLINQVRPRATIDTSKSSGGPRAAALEEKYRKALKEGSPLPSAEEINALTAKFAAG